MIDGRSVTLDWRCLSGDRNMAEIIQKAVSKAGIVNLTNFPIEPDDLVALAEGLGAPFSNYGAGQQSSAFNLHPVINRVRIMEDAEDRVQGSSSKLIPHNARAWGKVRPRFFMMLCVNEGWPSEKQGSGGESWLVRWEDVFEKGLARYGAEFEKMINCLKDTPIAFRPRISKEDYSISPLIYTLPDARHEFDLGARISLEILNRLDEFRTEIEDYNLFCKSVRTLSEISEWPDVRSEFRMFPGEMIIVDNNRIAHGRAPFAAFRKSAGQLEANPREMWSITIS